MTPIDRNVQNERAKKLFAADPGRRIHGDSSCWVAACLVAYDLVTREYTDEQYETYVTYYGVEALS